MLIYNACCARIIILNTNFFDAGRSHVKPDATKHTTQSNIKRPHQRKSGNGLSYTKRKTSITDDFEKPQSISSTSTFGFSPPQHPFFEASFYGQRPPPSALVPQVISVLYMILIDGAINVRYTTIPKL